MPFVAGQKVRASDLNSGIPQFARTTSDITVISSTTLVDATGLVLPMDADSVYALDGFIKYTTNTTPDIKFCLIGPAGSGGNWGIHGLQQGAANNDDDFEAFCLSAIGSANQIGLGGAGTGTPVWGHMMGHITTDSTAGTLQVQFAQVTSNASNTSVAAGSWISMQKIA